MTGLLLALSIFVLALLFLRLFFRSAKGRGFLGERRVRAVIGKTKAPERYVINNFLFFAEGRSNQIDHIVIRENGIFIIETKNYSGRIYGSESKAEWTQSLAYGRIKNKLYNPLWQNGTHLRRLSGCLPAGTPLFSAVVFVQGNVRYLQTDKVLTLRGLKAALKRRTGDTLSPEERRALYERLMALAEACPINEKEHVAGIHERQQAIRQGICPLCSGTLVLRKGRYGKFYGCSRYPACRFTKRL